MSPATPLPLELFGADPVTVARALLGASIVRRAGGLTLRARAVEVEAYDGADDPACARALRSPATRAAMAGPPGRVYMHPSYGRLLLNVVCRPAGRAAAILVRAAEPLEGLAAMRARRPGARDDRDLLRGPANLSRALGLDASLNGRPVGGDELTFEAGEAPAPGAVVSSPRVGLRAGATLPWRFFIAHDPCVSGPRARGPGGR
jgi:DNA-3-methyladenine glycosylase